METNSIPEIIYRIKSRRSELNLSYQELADKTGLSKSTLQRYETGSIKNMPLDKLPVIARALDVSPGWIMGFQEDKGSTNEKLEALATLFEKLNILGKDEALKRIEELTHFEKYTT